MAADRNKDSANQPEQAMNRILQAEQKAIADVGQCKQQVNDIINQAQLTAQRIRQRTDQRITRVNRHCNQLANTEINKIKQQQSERENQMQESDEDGAALTAAVENVSKKIIGIQQDE
jgi:hypothetical protein